MALAALQPVAIAPPDRRAEVMRWRRRSRAIRGLRILLPTIIGLILAAMVAAVAINALTGAPRQPKETSTPIRLVNPRFVGRDDKGRAFAITARSATRDPDDYQRVVLDQPALVMDAEGPDPLRLVAREGVYNEGSYKLDLHGGVKLVGAKGAFETAASLFDTKSGEVLGSGPIQGSGSLGEIQAKSYAITGKGQRMIFRGGVHTRLERK
jgi:lipopolysaccharide export system protein LptC